ncbi:MAG: U3 snoRNP protein [Watsoniomyces obsoletus]|nr:MAG: U3 snoRNP protein [Watsoniomyces obsoletus]
MSTSSPPEVPEFRGKTLTPVSPRPVHVAEPSNIPVLENQIDPAFNETSAHINPHGSRQSTPSSAHGNDDTASEQHVDHTEQWGFDANREDSNTPAEFDPADGDLVDDHSMSLDLDDETSDDELPVIQTNGTFEYVHLQSATGDVALTDFHPLPLAVDDAPETTLEMPVSPTDASRALQDTAATTAQQTEATEAAAVIEPNVVIQSASQDSADVASGGVNIQALLDNLSPAIAAPPPSEGLTAATSNLTAVSDDALPSNPTTSAQAELLAPSSSAENAPATRSPVHDEHTAFQLENPATVGDGSLVRPEQVFSSSPLHAPTIDQGAPDTGSSTIPRLATPPAPIFQQQQQMTDAVQSSQSFHAASQPPRARWDVQGRRTSLTEEDDPDPQWDEETKKLWDEFLDDEHGYVTEGHWDRFPPHSRLFIGNLPSEKVSKRDVFHVFHRYGRLAQISMKQAYGFVQFHDVEACRRALQAEQSHTIRGRKMHIEISKPQRNTRNEQGNRNRQRSRSPRREQGGVNRRSGSPDYSRGAGPISPVGPAFASGRVGGRPTRQRGGDRGGFPAHQDRGRDGHRPRRSPSPALRGVRGGDDPRRGRGRSHDRYNGGGRRSRSRSPPSRPGERYRSRSPVGGRRPSMEDLESLLPPRRVEQVPVVQIITTDDLDRGFVEFVEKVFRDAGITTDVLFLSPRTDVLEVVKRLAVEGVLAVSRLTRQDQTSVKIPLQIFGQRDGQNSVRFDEYPPQVPDIAVALVLRARQSQAPPPMVSAPNPYAALTQALQTPSVSLAAPVAPTYGNAPSNPDLSKLITTLDPAGLQNLLGIMQQQHQSQQPQQQQPVAPSQPQQPSSQISPLLPPDLARLLSSATRPAQMPYAPLPQTPSQLSPQQQQQQSAAANPYAALAGNPAFANNPNLASLLAAAGASTNNQPSQQSHQQIPSPNQHQAQQQPLPPHMLSSYQQYAAAHEPHPSNGAAAAAQPMPQLQSVMEQLSKWTK